MVAINREVPRSSVMDRCAPRHVCKLKPIEHKLRASAVEFFSLISAAFSYLVNLDTKKNNIKASKTPPKSTPVLMVHGYLHNSSAWIKMKKDLEAKGHTVFTINLGNPFKGIETYAGKVKKKAETIAKLTGRSDLVLVGHSMGGLVSSQYATTLAPAGSVKKIITIGTPFHGSPFARIGPGKCAKQMRQNSPFLKDLRQRMANDTNNIAIFNIGSKADGIVPAKNSVISGTKSENRRIYSDLGHLGLLYSKRVTNAVLGYLSE